MNPCKGQIQSSAYQRVAKNRECIYRIRADSYDGKWLLWHQRVLQPPNSTSSQTTLSAQILGHPHRQHPPSVSSVSFPVKIVIIPRYRLPRTKRQHTFENVHWNIYANNDLGIKWNAAHSQDIEQYSSHLPSMQLRIRSQKWEVV